MPTRRKVLILGAAGRDFHNFNVAFRGDDRFRVVAFTAAQIPYIAERRYPAELAGPGYPEGIPIVAEGELENIVRRERVQDVVFAYSDVSHLQVMHLASRTLAAGASFQMLGPSDTLLESRRPVVAVLGSRTGAGKSTVTRYLWRVLKDAGYRPVVVRHPMPYRTLRPAVERYSSEADLLEAGLTVEEMEEYAQHVEQGGTVFAGIDYARVLAQAEEAGDVILWDGGNNDMPFFDPDVTVTVVDPLRAGEEDRWFPGEVNLRAADLLVMNKANVARAEQLAESAEGVRRLNPLAPLMRCASVATLDRPEVVRGKRVLAVEDGPSVTHGGLSEAVAAACARELGAELVDPRPWARGSLREAYEAWPHLGAVLPALGYSPAQLGELEATIRAVPCDAVLLGTQANLARVIEIRQPVARARFVAAELDRPTLAARVLARLAG